MDRDTINDINREEEGATYDEYKEERQEDRDEMYMHPSEGNIY